MSAIALSFPSPLTPSGRDGHELTPGARSAPIDVLAGTLYKMHCIRPTRAEEIALILSAPRDDAPAAT